MAHPGKLGDLELTRRWVDTWRRAGKELEEIRRRELHTVDTAVAVRQLLVSPAIHAAIPPRKTSGLVEQQAWFSKLRQ